MKQINTYIAYDGTEFYSKTQCLEYEKSLATITMYKVGGQVIEPSISDRNNAIAQAEIAHLEGWGAGIVFNDWCKGENLKTANFPEDDKPYDLWVIRTENVFKPIDLEMIKRVMAYVELDIITLPDDEEEEDA